MNAGRMLIVMGVVLIAFHLVLPMGNPAHCMCSMGSLLLAVGVVATVADAFRALGARDDKNR